MAKFNQTQHSCSDSQRFQEDFNLQLLNLDHHTGDLHPFVSFYSRLARVARDPNTSCRSAVCGRLEAQSESRYWHPEVLSDIKQEVMPISSSLDHFLIIINIWTSLNVIADRRDKNQNSRSIVSDLAQSTSSMVEIWTDVIEFLARVGS